MYLSMLSVNPFARQITKDDNVVRGSIKLICRAKWIQQFNARCDCYVIIWYDRYHKLSRWFLECLIDYSLIEMVLLQYLLNGTSPKNGTVVAIQYCAILITWIVF